MNNIIHVLESNNLLLIFLSVGVGAIVGNIKFGGFKLGETIGALLAGISLSFLGFATDHELSTMCFSIFMFATGYGSSENIMSVFKKVSYKHVLLTVFIMLFAWLIVLFNVRVLGFNKAMAIGSTSGLLTNSAIIGVATNTLGNAANTTSFSADLAESFSIAYFISMCFTVIWCSVAIELIFKRKIKTDALENGKLFNESFYDESIHFKSKRPLVVISIGLTLGFLLGAVKIEMLGVHFVIGSLGCLISGIIVGKISFKKAHISYMQESEVNLLQSFGLSTFIAAIGLTAGSNILKNFSHNGFMLIKVCTLESALLLILATLVGKFILRYKNIAEFGGALAGARGASAGCAVVLDKAENNYPIPSFVVTFILSNLISIMFAPLIIFML